MATLLTTKKPKSPLGYSRGEIKPVSRTIQSNFDGNGVSEGYEKPDLRPGPTRKPS